MLKNPEEIEIISEAMQVNVRNPNRPRRPFFRILEDFLSFEQVNNIRILDLGPGQFDLGEILKSHNSIVDAIDFDPAVIKLGEAKGFKTFFLDMSKIEEFSLENKNQYDAVFCKYSMNAFWFEKPEEVIMFSESIGRILKKDGWAWLAPWNGDCSHLSKSFQQEMIKAQIFGFEQCGFKKLELSYFQSKLYGVNGGVHSANLAQLFFINRGLIIDG